MSDDCRKTVKVMPLNLADHSGEVIYIIVQQVD